MNSPLDISEFEAFFKANYKFLCLTSFQIVKDENVAKDLVQEFFMNLWQRRNEVHIQTSFRSYASGAVRNLSLVYLKNDKKEQDRLQIFTEAELDEVYEDNQDELLQREHIDIRVMQMVDQLPADRKKVFLAYVVEGLSYAQIAEKYGISVNTVKTQMKRAYAALKSQVSEDPLSVIVFSILVSEIIK